MQFKVLLAVLLILGLSGCATQKKAMINSQAEQLQLKVADLEAELTQKQGEIEKLKEELEQAQTQKTISSRRVKKAAGKISAKQIQSALQKAGFYNGPIDGQIGKKTKQALKEFQKANGLKADGVIGINTQTKLKQYLD